jgi:hypothetical protein
MRLFRFLLPYLPFIVLLMALVIAILHIRFFW